MDIDDEPFDDTLPDLKRLQRQRDTWDANENRILELATPQPPAVSDAIQEICKYIGMYHSHRHLFAVQRTRERSMPPDEKLDAREYFRQLVEKRDQRMYSIATKLLWWHESLITGRRPAARCEQELRSLYDKYREVLTDRAEVEAIEEARRWAGE